MILGISFYLIKNFILQDIQIVCYVPLSKNRGEGNADQTNNLES